MIRSFALVGMIALASPLSVHATPTPLEEKHEISKRCTATINSAADVTAANLACTTIKYVVYFWYISGMDLFSTI
jgi:polygalacturonase